MVNDIWGAGTIPLNIEKFVKKQTGKSNQYDIFKVLSKYSWITFQTIFETLSSLEACHVTITGGVVYKKSTMF